MNNIDLGSSVGGLTIEELEKIRGGYNSELNEFSRAQIRSKQTEEEPTLCSALSALFENITKLHELFFKDDRISPPTNCKEPINISDKTNILIVVIQENNSKLIGCIGELEKTKKLLGY